MPLHRPLHQSFGRVASVEVGPESALPKSVIFAEVLKLMDASGMRVTHYHFRDQQMHEVDIVLECDDGMVERLCRTADPGRSMQGPLRLRHRALRQQ